MTRRAKIDVRPAIYADHARTPLVGAPCKLLLVVLSTLPVVDAAGAYQGHPMDAQGRVKVSREELADALGIKPKDVSNRIAEAVRAGLLSREAGGRNGQVVTYRAHVGSPARAAYTGPDSLCGFVNGVVVGTTPVVPEKGSKGSVGTTGIAPYARAHYSTDDANADDIAVDECAERDHAVTEQAGDYKGWPLPPSRRSAA